MTDSSKVEQSNPSSAEVEQNANHKERHSGSSIFVRDTIIGMADGLTVPFALTAGLSALGSSRLVVIGGLAELFSGAISMGLGASLACITERQQYDAEEKRERREVLEKPEAEVEEIYEIFDKYEIPRNAVEPIVNSLKGNEEMWIKFMMDFELQLERPKSSRAWLEGLITGVAYFIGGLLPMIPYFAIQTVNTALFISIGITVAILLIFGYIKALVTGTGQLGALSSAAQTLCIGALAAGVSYGVVRGIDSANTL